jgi:hypothetical protein
MSGANHQIPIDSLAKEQTPRPKYQCCPWGDTITIGPFSVEADLFYIEMPPFPPAFLPPIPTGHFYPGDLIGYRTAQQQSTPVVIVKMGYTDTATGVSNTIIIEVQQKCPPARA